MGNKSKHSGFTLIELLVVVAIVGILAAILFPVFARARENARRSSCMSNLKQIGLGVMMYVQDYDETYPQYVNIGITPNTTWVDTTAPYIKSEQIFHCPSSSSTSLLNGNYGVNYLLLRRSDSSPVKLAAVQEPATGYMFFDYGTYFASYANVSGDSNDGYKYLPGMGDNGQNDHCKTTNTTAVKRLDDCQGGRHFLGVNMAFADGHVKWIKSGEVVNAARNFHSGQISPWNPAGL